MATRTSTSTPALTASQKAAAILAAMGRERASRMLKHFKHEELRVLIDAGQTLKNIPQPDLRQLVGEFEHEFSEGVGLLDSADHIRKLVDEELTGEELDAIFGRTRETVLEAQEPTIWRDLETVEIEKLTGFLKTENPQIVAFVCSKLSAKRTAEILASFGRPQRSALIGKILKLGAISPLAQQSIETALTEAFAVKGNAGGGAAEREKVADIISAFEPQAADEILVDLSAIVEEKSVAAVKKLVFRFEDIGSLPQAQRTLLLDALQTDVVTEAVRGASDDLREAVLSALSQRTRRMIEAELAGNAPIRPDAVEGARRAVMARAKKLIAEGQISPEKLDEAA